MEKDIDKIMKNPETDIVIRVDDFGGKVGVTIREFVKSERYTGFTKAGTRIPADKFGQFKEAINSINEEELAQAAEVINAPEEKPAFGGTNDEESSTDEESDEDSDIGEEAI